MFDRAEHDEAVLRRSYNHVRLMLYALQRDYRLTRDEALCIPLEEVYLMLRHHRQQAPPRSIENELEATWQQASMQGARRGDDE